MRSYAMGIFFAFFFIVAFSWSLGFLSDNLAMRENKNDSWKEYIYLASNKGYTRTEGFDLEKYSIEDLYTNKMPHDPEYTGDAAYYEITKDIADNSFTSGDIYFTVYVQEDEASNTLNFYVNRSIGDATNVMKIELREGK